MSSRTIGRTYCVQWFSRHRCRESVSAPCQPSQREYWYQSFHHLALAEQLVDGRPDAVRSYLRHFWEHWSGRDFVVDEVQFERLASNYSSPGAFRASIAWYLAGPDAYVLNRPVPAPPVRVSTPLTVLWPDQDPLVPREWSEAAGQFYADVRLRPVDGVRHFAPLEYPDVMADAILATLDP
jgi:pimeloyl-ACP methyl ester carboxylesterase